MRALGLEEEEEQRLPSMGLCWPSHHGSNNKSGFVPTLRCSGVEGGVGRDVSAAPRRPSQKKTHMQMMCAHIIALLSAGTKGRLMRVGGIPERDVRSARSRLPAAPSLLLLHEVDTETLAARHADFKLRQKPRSFLYLTK